MSITATRAALVAALNAADGVVGYGAPPSTPKSGDAFAFWAGATPPERGAYQFTYEHEWQVHVVCPADPVAADTWVELHLDDLINAVSSVLAITQIAPGRVPAGKSVAEYNALIITGRTE
jgi:hypothetical protein